MTTETMTEPAAAASTGSFRMLHTMIRVLDLDRSLAF